MRPRKGAPEAWSRAAPLNALVHLHNALPYLLGASREDFARELVTQGLDVLEPHQRDDCYQAARVELEDGQEGGPPTP